MKAGNEHPTNPGIDHNERASDNVTRHTRGAGRRGRQAGAGRPEVIDVQADRVTAAILVGGRARRLDGRSKPALVVGQQTIADRLLDAIRRADIPTVLMVGPWSGAIAPGVRHVPDVVGPVGPLGGLYSALLVAATPIVVVLAGDLPFVSGPLVRRLAAVPEGRDAVVPRDDRGWHPLSAGFRRTAAAHVKAQLDRGSLRVIDALAGLQVDPIGGDQLRQLDDDGMLLMNVNTPDDLRQAERHGRRTS
jgi:molybdopterin-guanine dinucleotide biosynthesis protein A